MTTQRGLGYAMLLLPPLLGCGDSPTAATGPEPEPEYVYAVDITTRYILIRGSCDTDIFGDEVPGEFQYRIVVSGPDGARPAQESPGYNEWNGTMYQRNATTTINFTNHTSTWSLLTSTGGFRVHLSLAEWDGVQKDSRMADRGGSVAVPYELGTHTRSITIGATPECQGRLYYDVTWSRLER